MDVVLTCPLGSECEAIKDNKLHRCRWFTEVHGTDAQGNSHNKWDCSLAWMPILLLESSTTNRSIAASIESARNVNNENQQRAIQTAKELGIN